MARSKKPRTSITLSEKQKARLGALAAKTGLAASEHVRRALDLYLARAEKEAVASPPPDPAPAAEA